MSFVIWMTGIPCSGKTTISKKLSKCIPNLAILDGDEVRKWFSTADFSKKGITENNIRISHIAKLLCSHNVSVCVSLVSPYKKNRQDARKILKNNKFIEVYLKCDPKTCEKRDVKGLYKKARLGLIQNFLGLDKRYQPPENPNLILDTETNTIEQSVQLVLKYLKEKKII